MSLTIGLDIGGTKIAGAVVDDHGTIVARARRDSGQGGEVITGVCADIVRELRSDHPDVDAVGLAVAGFVDTRAGRVAYGTNLGLFDDPMGERLESLVHLPVVLDNDANAAAYGEFRYGAGRDAQHMLLVTVGTGIGGGIVIDGELLRGASGFAAEIGHMRVVPDGRPCGCGNRGCWEMYASGRALTRSARSLIKTETPHAARLRAACNGHADTLKGEQVTELALAGDLASIEILEDLGTWLGVGAAQLAAILDPGLVVVGGGVVSAGDLILGPARHALGRHLTARGHRPPLDVVPAHLGNDAGMIGAAALADARRAASTAPRAGDATRHGGQGRA